MQYINALTKKAQRIALQIVLAILTLICLLAFNRCSLKRHIVSSSKVVDTSKYMAHSVDSSLFIDSSKYFTTTSKTEVIDTSNSNTIDEYERLMTQYYSKDPVTNMPVLDSSKTTEKGKKVTNEKRNKHSTQQAATTAAAINKYDQKSKEADSSNQKGVTESKNKDAKTEAGTPFIAYTLIVLGLACIGFVVYKVLKKSTPVGVLLKK